MKTAVVCGVSNDASCVEVSIDAQILQADNAAYHDWYLL